jgi:hypothetical protein
MSKINVKLPAQYCAPVPTPQKDLATKAWFNYDVSKPQPASLVMLKSMHNSITNNALDGTVGVAPGESFVQQKMLKDLKTKIDDFCDG